MNIIIDKQKALKWWGPACTRCHKRGYFIKIDGDEYALCHKCRVIVERKYKIRKMMRISPENITMLKENEIFIFGSNTAGNHGKGAAKTALSWGAKFGQGDGLQGKTYGIPTKDHRLRVLSIPQIKVYVDRFLIFAKNNPELKFLVTEIGCGLAGYKPKDIAPLFKDAENITNVYLPDRFWHKIQNNEKYSL